MNWANYLIQTNLYLMLFYSFYYIFLRNETFFQLNRIYLVGSAFISLLIPVMYFDWVKDLFITEKVENSWSGVRIIISEGFATPIVNESRTLGDYILIIYLLVTILLTIRLFYRLVKVFVMVKSVRHQEAFSFFNKIKVDPSLPQRETIIVHEKTHAQQLHSADVLLFEIIHIINWFNPVCYLYKIAIKQIHEFIADEVAMQSEADKSDYALLLFSKSFGVKPHKLINTFFNQSLLKRRIQMLQKKKSKKVAVLKYGLSVPLFLVALIFSSATISSSKAIAKFAQKVEAKKELTQLFELENVKESIPNIIPLNGGDVSKKTHHEVPDTLVLQGKVKFDRKKVLLVMGNVKIHADSLEFLDNDDVNVVEFFKGEEAIKKYGEEGRNGVVVILPNEKKYTREHDATKNAVRLILSENNNQTTGSNTRKEEIILNSPKIDLGVKRTLDNDGPENADQIKKSENRIIIKSTDKISGKASPLFILDDKEITEAEMKQISPNDIESVNVLKDKKATEEYGEKGKNGVIIIKMKKK